MMFYLITEGLAFHLFTDFSSQAHNTQENTMLIENVIVYGTIEKHGS